jgi:nucleoside-diphosphate-sugar epimerase
MIKYSESYWDEVRKVVSGIPDIANLFGKSVMITGATGMICSAVAELLFLLNKGFNANIRIVLAGRSRERMKQRFYCFKEGKDYSFLKYDATKGNGIGVSPDYIIHGASPADPASFIKEPVETMFANMMGLKNLLDIARWNKSIRLLYISSSEVYGKKEESRPYFETDYGYVDILNPRACYPSSKRAAETMCAAFHEEYGVDFVVVRPGHIYGPSITETDSRASAQFTRKAKAGENIVLKSAGMQLRSYTYTLDCASAILTVLLKGKCGEAYNISNPQSVVTIREMAEYMAKATGVSVVFEQASDMEKRSYNMMDNSSLDSSKLEKLGWSGCYGLEEGVVSTLDHYNIG